MYDDEWACPICVPGEWFVKVTELARHLILWHDEWLTTQQIPPAPTH